MTDGTSVALRVVKKNFSPLGTAGGIAGDSLPVTGSPTAGFLIVTKTMRAGCPKPTARRLLGCSGRNVVPLLSSCGGRLAAGWILLYNLT
jgi:hypothetical protein